MHRVRSCRPCCICYPVKAVVRQNAFAKTTLVQFALLRANVSHVVTIADHAMTDVDSEMREAGHLTTVVAIVSNVAMNVDHAVTTLSRVLRHLESTRSPASG